MFLDCTDLDVIEWKVLKSFAEQSHNRFNSASKSDNWSSTVVLLSDVGLFLLF